jgi:hypothetical protein
LQRFVESEDVDARHKAGHDRLSERRLRASRRAAVHLEDLHRIAAAAKKNLPQPALN